MRRQAISAVAASTLIVVIAAAPAAAAPGDSSCHGQEVSMFAHAFGGAAHAAEFFGVSVKDGQASIREFCAGG